MQTENFEQIKLNIVQTLEKQRKYFQTNETLDINFRKLKLKTLYKTIAKHEKEIMKALYQDLHKSYFEAYSTEIGLVYKEISLALKKLSKWAKPRRVPTPLAAFPGKSYIYYQPYGQVLIIAPWNYPFQLLFSPLVGAIAAGNTAILKPSPYAPHTARVMETIVKEAFKDEQVAIFQGHRDVNQFLLEQKFDFIFFTGSPNTGKVVMSYAAKNLTPVVLELGGKSPTIVDFDAKLKLAAKSIVFGKLTNAGQTCIAPDYLFVHKTVKDQLLKLIVKYIEKFYGKDQSKTQHYPRIINEQNVDRLYQYLSCGKIYYGGQVNRTERYFQPTIMTDVDLDCDVMKYEIFGPILPVLEFENLDEVIGFINSRPKPLALYYFGRNKAKIQQILTYTTSGGASINDTLMHFVNPRLPFGGVGDSGMGRYHGWYSFEAFSNKRAVFQKGQWLDLPLRYPPVTDFKYSMVRKVLK